MTTEGDRTAAPAGHASAAPASSSARCATRCSRGEVDLAVHSLKDLPTAPHAGIALAAVPPREDPRDVVVARDGLTLGELPAGSRVGTGSPRRAAQLHALGLGLEVVGHPRQRRHPDRQGRGRASTTRSCSPAPAWPGSAGSTRSPRCSTRCRCCPPPARARWRSSAAPTTTWPPALAGARRPATRAAVEAERAVLATLEGGCSAPVGALAEVVEGDDGDELWVRAVALSPDGALVGPDVRHRHPRRRRRRRAHGSQARCSPTERRDTDRRTGRNSEKAVTHDARQDQHRRHQGTGEAHRQPRLGVVRRQRPR